MSSTVKHERVNNAIAQCSPHVFSFKFIAKPKKKNSDQRRS